MKVVYKPVAQRMRELTDRADYRQIDYVLLTKEEAKEVTRPVLGFADKSPLEDVELIGSMYGVSLYAPRGWKNG